MSRVKCSPLATLREPWNIRCSKRWAKPVRPGASCREPTLTQRLTVTLGTLASGETMTRSPLGSVFSWMG